MEDLTGKRLGQYQVVAALGEGGMAAVYKAFQPGMERYVALKILPRFFASDPEFVGRFEQEAKVIARLQHVHVLPVFDFGEEDGYTFIVMPFIETGTLADSMRGEPLELTRMREVISQVGNALGYAHRRGLIHRDVKPSNILIDDMGNCLLTDFGIAKIVEGTVQFTRTGAIIGTPAYMSPEQILGHQLDKRTDIYSLGVVLFEMATGRPPYQAETPPAIFVKHLHDPLPLPRSLNPDLAEPVERVILKALAKEPDERYATAGEMARGLRAAIPEPIYVEEPKPAAAPAVSEDKDTVLEAAPDADRAEPAAEKLVGEPLSLREKEAEPLQRIPASEAGSRQRLLRVGLAVGGLTVLGVILALVGGGAGTTTLAGLSTLTVQPTADQIMTEAMRSAQLTQTTEAGTPMEETTPELTIEASVPIETAIVEFWTTDSDQDRVDLYEELAERYMADNPGVELRIVPVEDEGITQRIETARAANRLPDIIRMRAQNVAFLAEESILDEDAAEAVIASIGEVDFRKGPLAIVTNATTGLRSAVPYDGWIQGIWYRADVFSDLGLDPPVTWDAIIDACETLPGAANLQYGTTLPTDPTWDYGQQVFEQLAISSNAWPFDSAGNVTMDTPEMIAALEFFADLQHCATPGPQYWRGAREAYELGQAGMLLYSTYIMDDLVDGSGLEGGGTVDIAVQDLAHNTGFASHTSGPNGSATYGQLFALGMVKGAAPEAQEVVEFFLTGENYLDVLALLPFGKVPVLRSAMDGWKDLSPYFANYKSETLDQIANGYDTMQLWLFRRDYDSTQRAVIFDIERNLLIPQVLNNITIQGTMTAESGAAFLQGQVEALLAERQ